MNAEAIVLDVGHGNAALLRDGVATVVVDAPQREHVLDALRFDLRPGAVATYRDQRRGVIRRAAARRMTALGIPKADIARLAGVSRETVNRWVTTEYCRDLRRVTALVKGNE